MFFFFYFEVIVKYFFFSSFFKFFICSRSFLGSFESLGSVGYNSRFFFYIECVWDFESNNEGIGVVFGYVSEYFC